MQALRDTYAQLDALSYRAGRAATLLGATSGTLRRWDERSPYKAPRASSAQGVVPARLYTPQLLFKLASWRRDQARGDYPAPAQPPTTIAVSVIKGGTGKTTTTVETAVHLQLSGLRTLVIDADLQANATQLMGYQDDFGPEEAAANGLSEKAVVARTMANVVADYLAETRGKAPHPASPGAENRLLKMPFGADGPHLVPADAYLDDMELSLRATSGAGLMTLRNLFAHANAGGIPDLPLCNYDVVLIDCPPNTSVTSQAALVAADLVIAPIILDSFSVKGLSRLLSLRKEIVRTFRLESNLTILPTHYNPRLTRMERMTSFLKPYAESVSAHKIPASEDFPKAAEQNLPLALQKPNALGTRAYRAFAADIRAWVIDRAAHQTHNRGVNS